MARLPMSQPGTTAPSRPDAPSSPTRAGSRPFRWRLLMLCVAGMLPLLVAAVGTVAFAFRRLLF